MREVQFFWKRERVNRMGTGPLCDVLERLEFISYVKRVPRDVRGIFKVYFQPNMGVKDFDQLNNFEILEILSEPEHVGDAYLLIIRLNHAIVNLNARTNGSSAVAGKCYLDSEGLTYTVQGPALKLRLISIMARMIAKTDRISARSIHANQSDEMNSLSSKQLSLAKFAYDRGFFETPKRTRISDLADELGLARATVSEQLSKIESTLMHDMFASFSDVYIAPQTVRELIQTMEIDAADSGYDSSTEFKELLKEMRANMEHEVSLNELHTSGSVLDPMEESMDELKKSLSNN